MISLRIEKVQSIFDFSDIDAVFVSVVLKDKLLEVKESPLVGNLLPYLYTGSPCIGSVCLCTVRTLCPHNHKFDLKGL